MLFVIELWPYSVSMLVKWVAFLYSLHWPQGGVDLGVGGVSYVELLILYELWACERLSLEKAHPRYLRPGAPISVCIWDGEWIVVAAAPTTCHDIELWTYSVNMLVK